MKTNLHAGRRGFLLLEMILALAVFSMCITGFVVALNRMAKLAALAQNEMKITRFMDSALDETLSLPTLEEGTTESDITESGLDITFTTTVELLDDMQNEEGQILQEMYHITVKASWMDANRERYERQVDTWRYGRMYQP